MKTWKVWYRPPHLFARRNFRKKNLLNCMFPNFEDTPRNGEKHSLQAKCPTPVGKTKNWRDRLWHFLQGLISRILELAVQVCPSLSSFWFPAVQSGRGSSARLRRAASVRGDVFEATFKNFDNYCNFKNSGTSLNRQLATWIPINLEAQQSGWHWQVRRNIKSPQMQTELLLSWRRQQPNW